MGRAPCCEKMGLKKGPWTPEEDQILVSYIQKHGHGNWRALPKQAGLLRCGKSCRLRWTNYLRPDIKRGNFSKEEEETIYKLHELLGNRWSAIAAELPGRTDNEIKNVWHTHLKKRLDRRQAIPEAGRHEPKPTVSRCNTAHLGGDQLKFVNFPTDQRYESNGNVPTSPQRSSSNTSTSATDSSVVTVENERTAAVKAEYVGATDENLWSEALSGENTAMSEYSGKKADDPRAKIQFLPASLETGPQNEDAMDFWLNHFLNIEGEFIEFPKF